MIKVIILEPEDIRRDLTERNNRQLSLSDFNMYGLGGRRGRYLVMESDLVIYVDGENRTIFKDRGFFNRF